MTSYQSGYFDHVAIATRRWSDGFELFVEKLGGRWVRGGEAGQFAPCQLAYAGGIKVELIQPGLDPGGFVERFLDRFGLASHHLTFMVPDIDHFVESCHAHGFDVLPGFLELENRREVFVHPRVTQYGTLLQAISANNPYDVETPPPVGFPTPGKEIHQIQWVALAVPDLKSAAAFLSDATDAAIVDESADERSWIMLEWAGARRLLLIESAGEKLGVRHILVGRPDEPAPAPELILNAHTRATGPFEVAVLFATPEALGA